MCQRRNNLISVGHLPRVAGLCLLLLCTIVGRSPADPPIDPVPAPFYSFDCLSPTVEAELVGCADVLELDHPTPAIALPGEAFGLPLPGDDLDALSTADGADLGPTDPFVLLFSVDRATVGVADPAPELVALQVPYNVTDQASKGQAAGDQYMSTETFTRMGGPMGGVPRIAPNNTLTRNNYNEGGMDFSAMPPISAEDDGGGASNLDRLDEFRRGAAVQGHGIGVRRAHQSIIL